jgi:hypothetical protein
MKKLLLVCSLILLLSLVLPLTGASVTRSLVIEVSEDAYIVADINDEADTYGLRDTNYGDLEFVKAWYYWNVVIEEHTEEQEVEVDGEMVTQEVVVEEEVEREHYISVAYLKFDLSQLEGIEVDSAMLQLYARDVVLLTPRYVQVFLVPSEWTEAELTFNTAPGWGQTAISTVVVYQVDQWYGWDVTYDAVNETEAGEISFAVMLRDMTQASEEVVTFPSHESGENVSRLIVTYTVPAGAFAWYWWLVGAVVIIALAGLAFFGGQRFKGKKPSAR